MENRTQEIPIYKGGAVVAYALVDAEDAPAVSAHRWHLTAKGYAIKQVRVDGRVVSEFMHRTLLTPLDGMVVDHINRNRLDNRRANLRMATLRQNQYNAGVRKSNNSGYKGVHKKVGRHSYIAALNVNGKSVHLGSVPTAEAAAELYDAAARIVQGEFVYLNFPDRPPAQLSEKALGLIAAALAVPG